MEYMLPVAVALGAGMVLAWGLVLGLRAIGRSASRRVVDARGADRPVWAPGIWICASCRSSNPPAAMRCSRCRRDREELDRPPVEVRADRIPERIVVPAYTLVAIVHEPAAHADPGEIHWAVRVGGQTAGYAADRWGALRLLQAIDGADTIQLDRRGMGATGYALDAVIARFAAPAFPLDVPCPERGR